MSDNASPKEPHALSPIAHTVYIIFKGLWPSQAPYYTDNEQANAHCAEMERKRLAENEQARTYEYAGRGSAFMRPQHSDENFWVKQVNFASDESGPPPIVDNVSSEFRFYCPLGKVTIKVEGRRLSVFEWRDLCAPFWQPLSSQASTRVSTDAIPNKSEGALPSSTQ